MTCKVVLVARKMIVSCFLFGLDDLLVVNAECEIFQFVGCPSFSQKPNRFQIHAKARKPEKPETRNLF
jgi:hypothetical protein